MKTVYAWVDGGCSPNPGLGAWAAHLDCEGFQLNTSGTEEKSTNQRMEIMAACGALEALKKPAKVKIMSDSQYVVSTMSKGWSRRVNLDLWERLDLACEGHEIEWIKVKGHRGRNLIPHDLVTAIFTANEARS